MKSHFELLPGQRDLPGCGHEPSRLLLQRKADAPLKPVTGQRACDFGLFGDESSQMDLVSLANQRRV